MRYVIVTGMSGAGKTAAIHALEDIGFFCIDNLPPSLVRPFLDLSRKPQPMQEKVAFGIDIRSRQYFAELEQVVDDLKSSGNEVDILFMDCRDDVLIRRYQSSRRAHPLQYTESGHISSSVRLEDALMSERQYLKRLRDGASFVVDTTDTNVWQNRRLVQSLFDMQPNSALAIGVTSFGFAKGVPSDADLLFDVRFLPNPYYDALLRPKTGLDEDVVRYVKQDGNADIFLDKVMDLLRFLIPKYQREGKTQLMIAVGCTGGRHRSVAMAEAIAKALRDTGIEVQCFHRDSEDRK